MRAIFRVADIQLVALIGFNGANLLRVRDCSDWVSSS
jgi:hypothetical protein